jgi:hypothetical protein
LGILTLEDEVNAVSRNVGKKLPDYVAKNWHLFIITSIMTVVGWAYEYRHGLGMSIVGLVAQKSSCFSGY